MKTAFIYGGQGSQKEELGYDFYNEDPFAKNFYDNINYSKEIKDLSFKADAETLNQTKNTQLVLIAYEMMVTELLISKGICPIAACGLSIGEYAALFASNVLSKEDTINIAKFRGEAMDKASRNLDTSMYAVIKSDEEEIREIIDTYNDEDDFVEISNINSPDQIVISGSTKVMDKIITELKKRKIKSIKLKVSGPFHTRYMREVSDKLRDYFNDIDFNKPDINLYLNLTGEEYSDQNLREIMTHQVMRTVRFYDDIKNMLDKDIDLIIEIGAGSVLTKMISKWNKDIEILTIGNYSDYQKVLEKIDG